VQYEAQISPEKYTHVVNKSDTPVESPSAFATA
jgi:hypothetical protein